MLLKKIKTIILSRITKTKTEGWVKDRRKECKICPYNTLNMIKVPIKIKILKLLSDFYTFITFNQKTELGVCSKCGCDIFYKSQEDNEYCEENKWEKYEQGVRLNIFKQRKNGNKSKNK